MITKNSSVSAAAGCPGVNAALKAVLLDEPIDSFSRPDQSGHQALVRLAIGADALRAIGLDARCPNAVRFAAFEGWIGLAGEDVLGALDDATAGEMATVYGEAIRTTDDAAVWNLPPDVTSSVVARHLIVLGQRALPRLRPLLDDMRALPYAGSETSAIAGIKHYRVADLAAGVIVVIVGTPYRDGKTPADRERQLIELRARL